MHLVFTCCLLYGAAWCHYSDLFDQELFMVTHNAIPPGGAPVWMVNASIMESLDCSDQNTEPKMFGSTNKSYRDFCCIPGCSNQRGNDKINGWKRSYYRFPKDPKQASVWMKMIHRDHWEPNSYNRICSDHFEGGVCIFELLTLMNIKPVRKLKIY
jgi:hypothetical protein